MREIERKIEREIEIGEMRAILREIEIEGISLQIDFTVVGSRKSFNIINSHSLLIVFLFFLDGL